RHVSQRFPVVRELQEIVQSLAVEDCVGAGIETWRVSGGGDRVVPGLAIGNHLRGHRSVRYSLQVAPDVDARGESQHESVIGGVDAIGSAQIRAGRPAWSAD